jgi:CubicO group peptidase (beta-lactamase class C family)
MLASAAAALAALVALPTAVVAQTSTVVDGELGQAFDAYMREQAEAGFAGSMIVVKNGEIVFRKGFGLANPEAQYPNTPATVFDMGSIVKTFTLAAILKLEETGKLTTDDPLSVFFESVPTGKSAITIDQVITMSAGLAEYHDETGDFQEMDRQEAIQRIFSAQLQFQPGTDRAYSNSGYTLLAAIVEIASGTSFQAFVKDNLFKPAGMTRTGFYGERVVPDNLVAVGYGGITTFGERNAPQYWPPVTWALQGSGGAFGALGDLHNWSRAVSAGSVLGPKALEKYREYNPPFRTDSGHLVRAEAGGNDFGFNFVVLELVEDDGMIAFAQNNNPDGEEDPAFVRKLLQIYTTGKAGGR